MENQIKVVSCASKGFSIEACRRVQGVHMLFAFQNIPNETRIGGIVIPYQLLFTQLRGAQLFLSLQVGMRK